MQDRLKISKPSIERLTLLLRKSGFLVSPSGQEGWLAFTIHNQIRNIHDDKTVQLIRYFPDLVVYRLDKGCILIQAKSTTLEYYDGNNFSIETACLNVDKKLSGIGVKVFIVFENRPNEFYGNWVDKIETIYETTETSLFKGSKTPMALVAKSSVPSIRNFL